MPICSSAAGERPINAPELFAMLQPLTADGDYRHSSASGCCTDLFALRLWPRCAATISRPMTRGERVMATPRQRKAPAGTPEAALNRPRSSTPVLVRLCIKFIGFDAFAGATWSCKFCQFFSLRFSTSLAQLRLREIPGRQVDEVSAGCTDVRKLLIWKTNKAPAFGAFVVH